MNNNEPILNQLSWWIHHLEREGVQLANCVRLAWIDANRVTVMKNISQTVPDPYVTWAPLLPENIVNPLARPIKVIEKETAYDTNPLVVIASSVEPDNCLYEERMPKHAAPGIHNIGDAFATGQVFEADKAGFAIGSML